jgi:hypothetical protein
LIRLKIFLLVILEYAEHEPGTNRSKSGTVAAATTHEGVFANAALDY